MAHARYTQGVLETVQRDEQVGKPVFVLKLKHTYNEPEVRRVSARA